MSLNFHQHYEDAYVEFCETFNVLLSQYILEDRRLSLSWLLQSVMGDKAFSAENYISYIETHIGSEAGELFEECISYYPPEEIRLEEFAPSESVPKFFFDAAAAQFEAYLIRKGNPEFSRSRRYMTELIAVHYNTKGKISDPAPLIDGLVIN